MSEDGYFYVARAMLDHPVFAREPLCEVAAWLWLIREAAWKAHTVRVGKAVVDLGRGECAVSLRFLADRWRWSLGKVRRYLAKLEKAGMISIKTGTLATQITICNYEKYQDGQNAPGTEPAQKRHKQEGKKEKKEDRGGADAPPEYVFDGKIIRLKQDALERWRKSYSAIPDIMAELTKADDYYSTNPPNNGKWFYPVSRWLAKAHEEQLKKSQPTLPNGKPIRDADGHLTNDFLFARG